MGKKKPAWILAKKQKAREEKIKKQKNKKIAKFVLLGVAILIVIGLIIFGIGMANRPYYADIEIEGYGVITIELNKKEAPITVEHFINLAQSGFYDGTTFDYVEKEKMICGGYAKDGQEPAAIKGEFSQNGVTNNISHIRGTVSMVRTLGNSETDSQFYNSATSKFFIMQRDYYRYDGYYAAFGTVISGMDIVDRICNDVVIINDDGEVLKESQPVIKSITIKRSK